MTAFDLPALIEQAARARRPHLWGDFTKKLASLNAFTLEQAEESAAKKRAEAIFDVAVTLPVIAAGMYAPIRELHPVATVSRWRRDAVGDDHQIEERFCPECREDWPCPTVRAIDAVEAAIRGES
jgi:hypothetical protein